MNATASTVDIKVCGVTTAGDALACIRAGVTWLGINLVPTSPRHVDAAAARSIAEAVRGAAVTVAVVADLPLAELQALLLVFDRVQLHGSEPPALLEALGPRAYKAVRIGDAADVASARAMPGPLLLVDAKSPVALGGTGARFDWRLVEGLARHRPLGLAGGLTPDNVAEAMAIVRPVLVDVASGVEVAAEPRAKDLGRVRAFVQAVRGA